MPVAAEVELTLRRGLAVGQLGVAVAVEQLAELVARVGRVDQVRGELGVEPQVELLEASVEQRAHQRLGVVRHHRQARRVEGAERVGVQPGDVARRRVAHHRQTDERRPPGLALPVAGDGERLGRVAPRLGQRRPRPRRRAA